MREKRGKHPKKKKIYEKLERKSKQGKAWKGWKNGQGEKQCVCVYGGGSRPEKYLKQRWGGKRKGET